MCTPNQAGLSTRCKLTVYPTLALFSAGFMYWLQRMDDQTFAIVRVFAVLAAFILLAGFIRQRRKLSSTPAA